MSHKKVSFTALFTVVCLGIIILITIVQSTLFFINFRNRSHQQIQITMDENIAHLRDKMIHKFNEWSDIIKYTAFGAAPFMAQEPVGQEALEGLFKHVVQSQSDVWMLYCCSNVPWSEPGGYMIYDDGHAPPMSLDNTQRSWFINAKEKPGQIVYSEPFTSMSGNRFNISVSTSVYDEQGQDLGVVSGNVLINVLETILQGSTSLPQQRIFLLSKDGYFITDIEEGAIQQRDFFIETQLEQHRESILSSPSFFKMDRGNFIYSVSIPDVDWILLSMVPASAIFTGVNHFLLQMIGISIILISVVVAMSMILRHVLHREREENALMRDNLKVGFFLMDQNYAIQGQYSRILEHFFAVKHLRGKNFISLLGASLTQQETDTLKDYFDLAFHRSFEQTLLDDINPIQELSYTSIETGEVKILNCGFTLVNRTNNKVFILGNILDITTERTLEKQLAMEETKRQEEMHFFFEVIQVDPQVLRDFIEDAEYEFDKIDETLQDTSLSYKDGVLSIYQSIHAIKSNALIIGLQDFGEQLHELESGIKKLREQPEIPQEAMQGLAQGIDKIKEEKNKITTIIQKIQSFRFDGKRNQSEYVLVESLIRTCSKVSADLDKKVRLVVEEIDAQIIENGPRRIIKEILMQLIRNAVYHGIENCDERRAQGKDETGIIYLSIKFQQGMIHIRLGDDGKGIDFNKIRERAEKLHIIKSGQEGEDMDFLLQAMFAPGVSTAETEGYHAGRGIGLNLVQDRIQELKGSIQVHSEYHKGTVFTIFIPLTVYPRII